MACLREPASQQEKGIALVAVLWMVSALALAGTSLAAAMRVDIRLLQEQARQAEDAALGDAVITLAALSVHAETTEPGREIVSGEVEFDGRRLAYRAWPAAGFINPNTAPETLMRDLFLHAGRLDPASAAELARRVVAWRTPDPVASDAPGEEAAGALGPQPAYRRRDFFAVPEDLLQVPGMDLELFARIRPLVSVYGPRSGGVDALVAKPEVLVVLARGDEALAREIAGRRTGEGRLTDLTRLEQAHLARDTEGAAYRVEALVPDARGHLSLRAHWISLGAHERLPWRTLAVEPVVAVAGELDR